MMLEPLELYSGYVSETRVPCADTKVIQVDQVVEVHSFELLLSTLSDVLECVVLKNQ